MYKQIVLLSCLVTICLASCPQPESKGKYQFDYGVKDPHTGDHKAQWEMSNGDALKGGYTLDEPDGTKRVVQYKADKWNGFQAVVKRIGHAVHPKHYAAPFIVRVEEDNYSDSNGPWKQPAQKNGGWNGQQSSFNGGKFHNGNQGNDEWTSNSNGGATSYSNQKMYH
ncbi:larval/pupal rigid cuticle protein 66-like [Uranotaenia lowii]|uniref:larval/pupal rigid cuticle protein 66-like n=1 Tax=Uranotaenia lowii TaxID=190385 RepID=UPI00247A4C90|nr:larval/pupal rigid cuticle protein 66-like [Uranotaenia lowii]